MHEPVDCRQYLAALSFLTYSDQPGVAEGNVIHMQIKGELSLCQAIWELYFTTRLVSNYGIIML